MLSIFNINYDKNTDPWYRGLVDVASKWNLISLDFTSFDQHVTRGQMADMTTRYMKHNEGALLKSSPADVDLSYLINYLGFLKDYAVTYDSLAKHVNVEDSARNFDKLYGSEKTAGETKSFKDVDGNDLKIGLYNTGKLTEGAPSSCNASYGTGNYSLAITNKDNKILSYLDLGQREISDAMGADGIHYFDMTYEGSQAKPWFILEEYGSCNGNLFSFFIPDYIHGTLKPVKFSDQNENKIFAQSFKDITFDLYAITYKYYDNSQAKYLTKSYSYDSNKGEFVPAN